LKTTSTHAYHGIHDRNFAATKKKTGSMIVDSIKLAEVVDIDILVRRHARVLKSASFNSSRGFCSIQLARASPAEVKYVPMVKNK
jgi:hypothetical protein